MPDLQEVFRMATQKVGPDPGALERQHRFQRRATTRRKLAAFAVAAAIGVAAVVLVLVNRPGGDTTPADTPPTVNPVEAEPVGTVTFDGSTCSLEITADRIEPGAVPFQVVNATDKRVMFDAWQLLDGYTIQAFEAKIERDRQLAKKPGNQGTFPSEKQVRYLGSDVISPNSSGTAVPAMSSGPHAFVCLRPFEGEFRPFGVAGPILVR
jgi:hypothetical protein